MTAEHETYVERASTGAFYAWCSRCEWNSPRRIAENDARDAAKDHERKMRDERTVI